jgi:putative nucleotidyltransferase with HDIG domain
MMDLLSFPFYLMNPRLTSQEGIVNPVRPSFFGLESGEGKGYIKWSRFMSDMRILLVEENRKRRSALASFLEARGIKVEPADSLSEPPGPAGTGECPAVLVVSLTDSKSPYVPALRKLKRARTFLPVIAMVPPDASGAFLPFLEEGIIDQLVPSAAAAGVYSAIRAEELKAGLLRTAAARQQSLRRLKKEHADDFRRAAELEEIFETTLENFMAALDLRDVETYGHSKTVARYSHVLAEALGIRDQKTLDNIRRGALLHDAGKIAIPDSILKKPGPLTASEWEKVKRHPALGYGLIKDVRLVKEVGNIILCHHEKYDGTGYPRGLKGSGIPIEARIFAVADTLDAITSHRPYRNPTDFTSARGEIVHHSGTQFDPRVVEAFSDMDLAVWERIRFQTTRIIPAGDNYGLPAAKK